ncbi:MAG: cytochrome d ubiquinol oxidase subunit II [Chthoniobacteraceae bacterium]|nr:cytochrome d ubiquinol oxidase subunit II [Chthoniobacteraceae bacterium]
MLNEPLLPCVWFILVGVLFTGYAILDGFDLGIGALHLFTKPDEERRVMLNAIGPVWDGNEVWLVTGGGALFAAFPAVYATVFSGFYLAFMLLLVALIFRGVAIEFRGKLPHPWWRRMWDIGFSAGSVLSALLIGVALGNITVGIPLDAGQEYTGGFLSLLRPYPLLLGVTTVALFAQHGAIYGVLKTEGELHEKLRRWANRSLVLFAVCYLAVTVATLLYAPHMTVTLRAHPWLFAIAALNVLAIANVPFQLARGRDFLAFLSSSAAMLCLMALFGIGMFPHMVYSLPNPEHSLTLANAASSQKTLGVMLIVALIGVPLVLTYTISIYRIFRGKVKIDPMSY